MTSLSFTRAEIERSLPARLRKVVGVLGKEPAITCEDRSLTYDALDQASNQVARAVLDSNGPGTDLVVLLLEHGLNPIVALWGVLKAGKAYVALRPTDPPPLLKTIMTDTQSSLIITDRRSGELAARLAPDNCRLVNFDEIATLSAAPVDLRIPPDRLAAVFYTSGSTGKPKGVVHSHRTLLHMIWRNRRYYQLGPGDRYFDPFACGFIASAVAHFDTLLSGASLHLYNVQEIPAEQLAMRVIHDEITFLHPTLSLFRQLLDTDVVNQGLTRDPCRIRMVALSGENVSRNDVERFQRHFPRGCQLLHRFSTTETGPVCNFPVSRNTPVTVNVLPVGYPAPDTEILLLRDDGKPVHPGEAGEIAVKSRYISTGYWRQPELTRAKFLADPEGGDRRLYLTCDLGRQAADGCLEHCGRKDFELKIRGYSVSPAAIEAALLDLPEVKEAVVVAQQDRAGDNQQLVAYIVTCQEPAPTATALRRSLAYRLPDYMIPALFVCLERLPLTATGKIDRRALPAPDPGRPNLEKPYTPPRASTEETLVQIWTDVLKVDRVGIHDNFFDLGGQSLAATRVVSRVVEQFQLEIPLQYLFQSPTIADMAKVIAAHQNKKLAAKDLEDVLIELESLSEEEAKRLVDEARSADSKN